MINQRKYKLIIDDKEELKIPNELPITSLIYALKFVDKNGGNRGRVELVDDEGVTYLNRRTNIDQLESLLSPSYYEHAYVDEIAESVKLANKYEEGNYFLNCGDAEIRVSDLCNIKRILYRISDIEDGEEVLLNRRRTGIKSMPSLVVAEIKKEMSTYAIKRGSLIDWYYDEFKNEDLDSMNISCEGISLELSEFKHCCEMFIELYSLEGPWKIKLECGKGYWTVGTGTIDMLKEVLRKYQR